MYVAHGAAFGFCSDECLRAWRHADRSQRAATRRRVLKWSFVVVTLTAGFVTPHDGPPIAGSHPLIAARPSRAEPAALPGEFGPEWPPSEESMIAELGRDAWFHPLAGPFRRMPERDSRVFGAERAGDRPIECRKGHCGVDLGGEIWGEYVRAAHDGIVDRVVRAPNELRGGHYVRIAHHNATVFTQYFHLAAIPRWVVAGAHVKAGDVIGLLGDTGVKESTAHLHFTVSVRPAQQLAEQYIDPEPLVALWPLHIPVDGLPIDLVSTEGRIGLPLGGAPVGPVSHALAAHVKKRHKHAPKPAVDKTKDTPAESGGEDEDADSDAAGEGATPP